MKKTAFGKWKKTIEQNMDCFLLSSVATLNMKNKRTQNPVLDKKYSNKFKKYINRMISILEGSNKKIPSSPETF